MTHFRLVMNQKVIVLVLYQYLYQTNQYCNSEVSAFNELMLLNRIRRDLH